MIIQKALIGTALALIATAVVTAPATSYAGSCPADKVGVNVMKPGPMAPKAVTDVVLAASNLGERYKEFDGKQLRLRRLVVQPGGIVPWHEHPDRPANIYVVDGEITEYRSTCAVPIVH